MTEQKKISQEICELVPLVMIPLESISLHLQHLQYNIQSINIRDHDISSHNNYKLHTFSTQEQT